MARFPFGGGLADWTFAHGDEVAVGPLTGNVAVVLGGVAVTFWSAETGGEQYTDLLDIDGNPVTIISSSMGINDRAMGQIPPFFGPEGVTELWAQAGDGPRARMFAGGSPATIDTLGGVDVSNPANGEVLRYNGFWGWTAEKLFPGDISGENAQNRQVMMWVTPAFGGWVSTYVNVNDLGDVPDTNSANGDMLRYNSGASQWDKVNLNSLATLSGEGTRPFGTNVALTGVEQITDQVTFTARTGASYKVTYDTPAINGATVGDVVTIRIRYAAGATLTTAGTQIHSRTFTIDRANTDLAYHFHKRFTPNINGQVTVGVTMYRSTGAGAISAKGDCSLLVEGYH